MEYIEEHGVAGSKITVDPKWSGIQDGVTIEIRHKAVSGLREAENLIMQILETVRLCRFGHFRHISGVFDVGCPVRSVLRWAPMGSSANCGRSLVSKSNTPGCAEFC